MIRAPVFFACTRKARESHQILSSWLFLVANPPVKDTHTRNPLFVETLKARCCVVRSHLSFVARFVPFIFFCRGESKILRVLRVYSKTHLKCTHNGDLFFWQTLKDMCFSVHSHLSFVVFSVPILSLNMKYSNHN